MSADDDRPDEPDDTVERLRRRADSLRSRAPGGAGTPPGDAGDGTATGADEVADPPSSGAFFDSEDHDHLVRRWADTEQVETVEPRLNWSNLVALVVVAGAVALAVFGAWSLIERSGSSEDGSGAPGSADGDPVLEDDAPTLEDLGSGATLPPGPDGGLAVVDHGVTVVTDRFDDSRREGSFAVILRNPHESWLAQGVQVHIRLVGPEGGVLGDDSSFVEVVLPEQEVAVASLFLDAPTEPVADLDVDVDIARWRQTGPFDGRFTIRDVETAGAELSGVVTTFEIVSGFDRPLTDVGITAVYRGADGAVLGGYDTFIEELEPDEATAGEIALLANIEIDDVASTELYPTATFGFIPDE